jgi:hypothetical protein
MKSAFQSPPEGRKLTFWRAADENDRQSSLTAAETPSESVLPPV